MDIESEQARARRTADREKEAAAASRESQRAQEESALLQEHDFGAACWVRGWMADGLTRGLVAFFTSTAMLVFFGVAHSFVPAGRLHDMIEAADTRVILGLVVGTFAPGIVLAGIMAALSRPAVPQAAAAERAWLASLPFPVEGVEAAYSTAWRTLKVELTFAPFEPGEAERTGILASERLQQAVLPCVSLGWDRNETLEIRLSVDPDGSGDWRNRRRAHLLFHDLVTLVLRPLHEGHGLRRVVVS